MSFLSPKWDASQGHYVINTSEELRASVEDHLPIAKDNVGSTVFTDVDALHEATDDLVNCLIDEGQKGKWFSKLPSHDQLMKRTRHTFSQLASDTDTCAVLTTVLMTPKLLTFVWMPLTVSPTAPPLCFEDSDSDAGTEPELSESSLPPVVLKESVKESQEEYLLTRLRAAKARVEIEQIRMQYFDATGRMPPDSESEDD
jgi:hypothetical protein